MYDVLNQLIEKISAAPVDSRPTQNIYMEEMFPPAIYQEMLMRLPKDEDLDFIEHPDAVLPNGRKTRKLLDLSPESIERLQPEDRAFWTEMMGILTSTKLQIALFHKFRDSLEMRFGNKWPDAVTVPIFYRDYPGYRIGEHTDAPYKLVTMQFYLPRDNSQRHLGTSFHLRENNQFKLLKTNDFKPNSAYAFVRTDESWHSVKQLADHESIRNTLALTIYVKGQEYKSASKEYR